LEWSGCEGEAGEIRGGGGARARGAGGAAGEQGVCVSYFIWIYVN